MDKLTELKAQAYDLIANIEYLKNKLKEVNQKIAELAKQENDRAADTIDHN
jgi:uncharacterized coiled-coil DUF342 family protein